MDKEEAMTPKKWMKLAQNHAPELRLLARLYATREVGTVTASLQNGDHITAYEALRKVWYNIPIDNDLTEKLPGTGILHVLCTNYGGPK